MSEKKTYKTIGEVSDIINVPEYVLRFWETKFPQISPEKINGRRYYSDATIENIRQIKTFLYDKGMTIKGALIAFSSSSGNNKNQLDTTDDNLINQLTEIKSNLVSILKRISSKTQQ